jgi:apolipoprotein N-acyltransferase
MACVAVVLLYLIILRRVAEPIHEGTQATATLVQENLGVGAEASSGPPLTQSDMLRTFSELSLFPPNGGVCNGIPELPGTHCSGPVPAQPNRGPGDTRFLQPTDLIVWPEAPNDFYEIDPALRAAAVSNQFHAAIFSLARAANAPIIVGTTGIDKDSAAQRGYDQYNSADFIAPDGHLVGRYDKMHLVPFGEYTPYKRLFFFAGSLLQDVGLFDPGKHRTVFPIGGHTYGTFICYESVFGDEMRQYAKMGTDVLVNISDDGWYGDTSAAWEHLNMVRMRAIENHRWVLRATNTGVTAAIDPYGRVVTSAPRHIRTSLRAGFDYEHDITFYSAHGDLFAYFCALMTAGGLGLGLLRRAT